MLTIGVSNVTEINGKSEKEALGKWMREKIKVGILEK